MWPSREGRRPPLPPLMPTQRGRGHRGSGSPCWTPWRACWRSGRCGRQARSGRQRKVGAVQRPPYPVGLRGPPPLFPLSCAQPSVCVLRGPRNVPLLVVCLALCLWVHVLATRVHARPGGSSTCGPCGPGLPTKDLCAPLLRRRPRLCRGERRRPRAQVGPRRPAASALLQVPHRWPLPCLPRLPGPSLAACLGRPWLPARVVPGCPPHASPRLPICSPLHLPPACSPLHLSARWVPA